MAAIGAVAGKGAISKGAAGKSESAAGSDDLSKQADAVNTPQIAGPDNMVSGAMNTLIQFSKAIQEGATLKEKATPNQSPTPKAEEESKPARPRLR